MLVKCNVKIKVKKINNKPLNVTSYMVKYHNNVSSLNKSCQTEVEV